MIRHVETTRFSSTINKMERAEATIRTMLADRGCGDIKTLCKVSSCRFALCCSSTVVYFVRDIKLKVGTMREILKNPLSAGKSVIFVCENGITPYARKELDAGKCQVFSYSDLYIPVTHHVLVPPHRRLEGDEKMNLLKKYPAKALPGIFSTDPVAKYYFFKPGDVVEIRRNSVDGHEYKYYRIVII